MSRSCCPGGCIELNPWSTCRFDVTSEFVGWRHTAD
jgi:hypothetical protein